MYIDSHCHIHDTEFYPDNREEVYQESRKAGVTMFCVGTDIRSSREAVAFARSHEGCYAIVGIHPHEAKDNTTDDIRALLDEYRENIVGIGEIGLDYFYDHSPQDVQQQRLREQLALAQEYQLPVSFHVRDAVSGGKSRSVWHDFWPVFDEYQGLRGVLHSFTDTNEQAAKGVARGLSIGINGIATFTKQTSQLELYRDLPLDRVLLETDAPFLTPKPFRGKMNTPAYVELVARYLATLRGLSPEEVMRQTTTNAKELFGITP